ATACASPASGNIVPGSLNGAPSGQTDEFARLSGLTTQAYPGYGGNNGIHVTGVGVVTVMPDIAMVSLGVETFAPNVEEARTQAAEAMQGILESLRAAGID